MKVRGEQNQIANRTKPTNRVKPTKNPTNGLVSGKKKSDYN